MARWRKEMPEELAGYEKDQAGYSTKGRMHEPELRGRHSFEHAADPADKVVSREEVQEINPDDG